MFLQPVKALKKPGCEGYFLQQVRVGFYLPGQARKTIKNDIEPIWYAGTTYYQVYLKTKYVDSKKIDENTRLPQSARVRQE